jgi:hypothetical protein
MVLRCSHHSVFLLHPVNLELGALLVSNFLQDHVLVVDLDPILPQQVTLFYYIMPISMLCLYFR